MKKKWIIIVVILLILIIGYVISTLLTVVEVQEESPLEVKDLMDIMDAATKADFEKQTEAMKDKVIVMDDLMPKTSCILLQGNFKPRAHDVEGKALLIESNGKKTLRFEDFNTINGPRLHIYLSSELGNVDFVDLGKIKATKGNVNYDLPPEIDTTKYNKVLVWCKPFSILFGYAELK